MAIKRTIVICLSVGSLILALGLAFAAGQYDPGVSDTEIKIGNTMPYSGSASALGVFGRSEGAYFAMINDQGGINGRKINFISRGRRLQPTEDCRSGAPACRGGAYAVAVQHSGHAAQHRHPVLNGGKYVIRCQGPPHSTRREARQHHRDVANSAKRRRS